MLLVENRYWFIAISRLNDTKNVVLSNNLYIYKQFFISFSVYKRFTHSSLLRYVTYVNIMLSQLS